MAEEEFVDMINRLCLCACAECAACEMGRDLLREQYLHGGSVAEWHRSRPVCFAGCTLID